MDPYHVPVSAHPLLADPPFVLWILLVAAALGRRTLLWFGVARDGNALERSIVGTILGLGYLQYPIYGLGMASLLTPRAVWTVLVVVSLAALPDLIAIARSARGAVALLRDWKPSSFVKRGLLVLALPLFAALLGALTPPTDADGIFYHLTAPKRWLQFGDLRYLPTLVHTNSLMGTQMLYTLAMAVWSDTAAKLIHFAFGVLTLLAVFALGRRLKSAEVGVTAAGVWMLGLYLVPTLDAARLFSYAYVDLALSAQSTAAILAWVLYSRNDERGWGVAAALCGGFALTTKLPGVFLCAALSAAVLLDLLKKKRALSQALISSALFGVIALVPALPWFARSFLQTGSPIYLMLPSVFPTLDWSPEAGAAFGDYFKYYVWGTGYRSLGWSVELRKVVRALALLATLAGVVLAVWRIKQWELRVIVGVVGVLFLGCIAGTGLYLRYLVPFLPPLYAVVFALGGDFIVQRAWAQSALLAFIGLNGVMYLWKTVPSVGESALVALGQSSRESFLERQISVMPLWQYTNENVPRDGRILLAAGRPSYFIEPYCFLTEAYYQARLRMDTWEHFLADVRRDRIEYAIVPDRTEPSAPTGPKYAAAQNEMPFAHQLVAKHGKLLHTVGTDHLYRLEGL